MAFKEGVIIGPISFNATGSANTAIGATSNTGTISIGNSASGLVAVDCGSAGINIGATANSHLTTIGSLIGNSRTEIRSGSTNSILLQTSGGPIQMTTGTGQVLISADANNNTIDIGNGAAVKIVNLGSATSTSATTILGGSGGVALQTTGTLNLSGLNSPIVMSSGTGTISISNDSSNSTINIGTGNAVKTVTLGSTNSTSSTLIRGGTGASSFQPTGAGSLSLGSTNTGATTLGNLTGTTTINFGGGSALSTYVDWTTFTPTAVGRSVAGSTTYVTQAGFYVRIGNTVLTQFTIIYSAATGTGDILIGGLPFTINGASSYQPTGACIVGGTGVAWPASTTSLAIQGLGSSTTAVITVSGSSAAQSNIQMANTTTTIIGTLMYRI